MQIRFNFSFTPKMVGLFLLAAIMPSKAEHSEEFWVLTNPEAPFVVVDDKSRMSGYLVDVVKGILDTANIHQEILAAPWERVEREARVKSNVLAFALARTKEREDLYHWITPLTANVYSVFSTKGKPDQFVDITQLLQIPSIAVLENDARHKVLVEIGHPNIQAFTTWQEAIDAVSTGNSEAIFFSDPGIQYFCARPGKDCKDLTRVFMYEKILSYLTLSKVNASEELVNDLMQAAKRFKQSEHFDAISKRWLLEYETQPIPMHLDDGVLNLWNQ